MKNKSIQYVNDLQDITNSYDSISADTEKKFSAREEKVYDFYESVENPTKSQMKTDYKVEKIGKRTRPKDGSVLSLPDRQATITAKEYTMAISFCKEGRAYLELFDEKNIDKLLLQDGMLYLKDNMISLAEDEIQSFVSKKFPNTIDLNMLRAFYSVILKEYEKVEYQKINSNIVIYVPELLNSLGKKGNRSQEQINKLINDINQYKNVVGVVNKYNDSCKRRYKILNFQYYDQENNTIAFNAPYLEYIIREIHENAICRDKTEKKIQKKNGKLRVAPTHSFLIKNEIAKERNHMAVENVNIIVTLIEQAGGTGAHISAQTIVNRNAFLKQRLDECEYKNRQQILNRTFKKTWEILRTMTDIENVYEGITLPEPDSPNAIPKEKMLKTTVWEFNHNGKKKT